MKTIYLDSDFKCHITNNNQILYSVTTDFFDGKCDAYIEGYRIIPEGHTWTRYDGVIISGGVIYPWKDHSELKNIQQEYEQQKLLEYENIITELTTSYIEGVNSI